MVAPVTSECTTSEVVLSAVPDAAWQAGVPGSRVVPEVARGLGVGFRCLPVRAVVRQAVTAPGHLDDLGPGEQAVEEAPVVGTSPSSFPQSSTGRFEVMGVDRDS